MAKEYCKWQFFKPGHHRVNAAERGIQKFKNHLISGLCKNALECPVQLWDHLAEQTVITINLLREYLINANAPAYNKLHVHKYNWNAHSMAPPGSRGVIYEDTDSRLVWVTQGTVAWYIRLSLNHYRVLCWFIPETNGLRFSSLLYFLPQYCLLP